MNHLFSMVITLVVEELGKILIKFIKTKMGWQKTYTYQKQYKKAYR